MKLLLFILTLPLFSLCEKDLFEYVQKSLAKQFSDKALDFFEKAGEEFRGFSCQRLGTREILIINLPLLRAKLLHERVRYLVREFLIQRGCSLVVVDNGSFVCYGENFLIYEDVPSRGYIKLIQERLEDHPLVED